VKASEMHCAWCCHLPPQRSSKQKRVSFFFKKIRNINEAEYNDKYLAHYYKLFNNNYICCNSLNIDGAIFLPFFKEEI
jgi:hypothetical protein